jgi:ribonuclease Z
MGKLIVLGSSYAIPDETHDNTHFALVGRAGVVLVDCASRPVTRLRQAGLAHEQLTDVVLTHFHPDHVYGIPMLIMELWLRGRAAPLWLHGLEHCMTRTENLMLACDVRDWPKMFPLTYHAVAEQPGTLLLDNSDFRITATPVKHFVPTLGLRVEDKHTGRVLAYSCDTEPCPGDQQLAQGADLLLHECAGKGLGHTSAAQAGEIAAEARAKRLVLIHYPTGGHDTSGLVPEAQAAFGGPVTLAEDLMTLEW